MFLVCQMIRTICVTFRNLEKILFSLVIVIDFEALGILVCHSHSDSPYPTRSNGDS
jgi:hypothetical protein